MAKNQQFVAVRNVILVSGYDYQTPTNSFDEPAFARILELFAQKEHLRYPLRFHLLSVATGTCAETVVFDRDSELPSDKVLQVLKVGPVWQRVDARYAPPTADNYRNGNVFTEKQPRDPSQPVVLSITDVYRYLYSFWDAANNTSPKDLVAFDAILELSFFAHAAPDTISLVNSVDKNARSRSRDPSDKDARIKDFSVFSPDGKIQPSAFWSRIKSVFDRAAGKVRIWGSDPIGDTPYYAALIRAALDASGPGGRAAPPPPRMLLDESKDDPIPTDDPLIAAKLGSAASSLTLGTVKTLLAAGKKASYAAAIQKAIGGSVYVAPLGAVTSREQTSTSGQLLFAVPKSFSDVVGFHSAVLNLPLDGEGRKYGILGQAPAVAKEDDQATSPLAGLQLFQAYPAPFAIEGPSGRLLRDKKLQELLMEAARVRGFTYSTPLQAPDPPAIAIADVSESPPYPYAATPNDESPYYAASLLKSAALFAAARMRVVVQNLNKRREISGKPVSDVLRLLAPLLGGVIDRGIDFSRTDIQKNRQKSTLQWEHRVPHYEQLFASSSPVGEISQQQETNIVTLLTAPDDSNQAAMNLIHSLGYAWINGVMRFSGFPGVWLAGDFSGRTAKQGWPAASIPSNNDELAAQVTRARDMASLFAVISRADLEETIKVRDKWLSRGAGWSEQILTGSDHAFYTTGAKLGEGPLKKGGLVFSDARMVAQDASPRQFVAVWLNAKVGDIDKLVYLVRAVLQDYTK